MFTTFDRYLLGRLLHTFSVLFVSAYGLYIVIDLFTNIDDFQANTTSNLDLLTQIVIYYIYRGFQFFEMAGPMLIVVSVITVLGLLRKHSETFPILAAGIPAFRMLKPLLLAAAILNAALIANQELIIPNIAVQLQTPRGSRLAQVQKVEAVYDHSNYLMHIDGEQVLIESKTLVDASFALPEPELATQFCVLKAEQARFVPANKKHPSGWLLQNLTGVFNEDILTAEGRQRVLPRPNGKDLFIVSDVSFDQLYNRGRNVQFLSSMQLIQRLQNPSTGPVPVRRQSIALHCRITRPFLCLINIAIALPLVFRKESHSLITNMAVCAAVLGAFYALAEGSFALAGAGLLAADLAAWLPVIVTGVASTWTSGLVQT
ncbi:MAG: LptF/LptG family permease [Planctomycetota bacterium]|jgi:lipopolysaccharide export system permease protein|nr:MAG: LptF/LptG family permease [Planctomycetota bacterium]